MDSTVQSNKTKLGILKSVFLLAIILLIGSTTFGQSKITATDTVCAGSQDVVYGILNPLSTSSYKWTLSGGGVLDTSLVAGASDSIVQVDWGTVTGTFNLTVVETTITGCIGDTVSLDIVISPLPTMTLVNDSVCINDIAVLEAEFTGTAPWIFEYTDGTTIWTDTATTTPWNITMPAGYATTQTITVNSLQDAVGCDADVTLLPNAQIYVYPKPATGAIFHY